jgi:hypothetical protein
VDGGNGNSAGISGTYLKVGIFEIELNTFGTEGVDWTTSIFYTPSGGSSFILADQVFTNDINYVGFSAASGLTGSMDNFSLSAVPEPSSAIAGLLIVSGLFRRRRN